MDIINVVDDLILKFGDGGWVIKVFVVLYVLYQQVIFFDVDCVFVQLFEKFFQDFLYIEMGVFLFYDCFFWQYVYKDCYVWWWL